MSLPPLAASATAIALLLAATVGPKIWLQQRSAQIDEDQLLAEVSGRLDGMGFTLRAEHSTAGPLIKAVRGPCLLSVRNGDRARELGTLYRIEGAGIGPVLIGYRGEWTPDPAPARAVIERFTQNNATRVGLPFARPAVVAVAKSAQCGRILEHLNGIMARSYLTPRPSV